MPDSLLVLMVAIGLFAIAMSITAVLVDSRGDDNTFLSVVVSVAGYGLYYIVMLATGFSHRFRPTVSCIMACGSILTLLMILAFLTLAPLVGPAVAQIVAWLVLFWSVPVKGHIIAHAIERHWYVGIAIALTIFILQQFAYESITASSSG